MGSKSFGILMLLFALNISSCTSNIEKEDDTTDNRKKIYDRPSCGGVKTRIWPEELNTQFPDIFYGTPLYKLDNINWFLTDKEIPNLTLNDFKGDTLAYFETKILNRKSHYIGKKFDILLNDLNIPIKHFLYSGDHNDITAVSGTIFLIYDGFQIRNKLSKGEIPVNLVVQWTPSLKAEDLDKLNSVRGKRGEWNPRNEAYFRKQIVWNIGRTYYNPEKNRRTYYKPPNRF